MAEIVQCDQLVAESTFALPVYAWQEQSQVFDEMARWCVRCIERRVRPVLLCYSLGKAERVMVVLDSNHTHTHVYRELELYAPLVTKECYLVVCDTLIEDMPAGSFSDRPWDKGNNPRTAVDAYLKTTSRFEVDQSMDAKLQISVAPGGYLKCVMD